MNKNIEFIKSKTTGGHYGFKTDRAKKVFTNKMTEALGIDYKNSDIVIDIGGYVGEFSLAVLSLILCSSLLSLFLRAVMLFLSLVISEE